MSTLSTFSACIWFYVCTCFEHFRSTRRPIVSEIHGSQKQVLLSPTTSHHIYIVVAVFPPPPLFSIAQRGFIARTNTNNQERKERENALVWNFSSTRFSYRTERRYYYLAFPGRPWDRVFPRPNVGGALDQQIGSVPRPEAHAVMTPLRRQNLSRLRFIFCKETNCESVRS